MPYLDYATYTSLGYNSVPETSFNRWATMAEQTIKQYVSVPDDALTDENRMGACEITDVLYINGKATEDTISGSGGAVKSFSNQKYSESYATATLDEASKITEKSIMNFLKLYFPQFRAIAWVGRY